MLCAIKESKNGKFELTLMVMWRIWCARNSKAHEQGDLEKNTMRESSYGMLQEFSQVNHQIVALIDPRHAPLRAWSAPSYGVIKINYDAEVLGNDGVSGLGFVMRCHNGLVLVVGCRRVAFSTLVVEAEAKAILWATQMAQAKGFANVVLETDYVLTPSNKTKCCITLELYFSTFKVYASCQRHSILKYRC
nr:reverse transcriptase [Tanacetum cinerariifolium]